MTGRIQSIDILRGIALLGLPTMNMIVFAMPFGAYMNPIAYGESDFLNHTLFSFFYLFADQKFMGMFSLLFGVSVMLMAEKNQQAGRSAAGYHYLRNLWLLGIGFLHLYFVWEGDVLMYYATIALLLYPFKFLNKYVLAMVPIFFLGVAGYLTHHSDISAENFGELERAALQEIYLPNQAQIEENKSKMLGSYADTLNNVRSGFSDEVSDEILAKETALMQYGLSSIAKVMGMMSLGILLYQFGVIQGQRSQRFYRNMGIAGVGIGLPITAVGLVYNYATGWQLDTYFMYGLTFKEVGSTFMVLGYIGFIMLSLQRGLMERMARLLSPVGRMALTNYLMQSVICALIFYGYGLGLHGSISRLQFIPIIVGIWAFQIAFSLLWLSRFKQGPVEWVWRTLTYFKFPSRSGGGESSAS